MQKKGRRSLNHTIDAQEAGRELMILEDEKEVKIGRKERADPYL